MESFAYFDLLQRLEGFDPWLISLGLTPRPNDRIHQAFKILRKADEASRKGRETGIYSEIQPADWFAIIEALEAHDIFLAFHKDSPSVIAPVLKRALSGPPHPIDESPKNRDGRNIWFELTLAAEWKLRGVPVSLGEPDLRLIRDGVLFLVACKRPATTASIDVNIRGAIKQLQRNLDRMSSGTFGVAAISLNCVFNPGDLVFSGEISDLGKLLDYELDQHRRFLSSVDDPRVCCILLHVATPGVGEEGVDLLRSSYCIAKELHSSVGSKAFGELLREMRG